jgi:hypothetical protein
LALSNNHSLTQEQKEKPEQKSDVNVLKKKHMAKK